ncbi:helix-turn-helix domain-containing protein [Natronococcus sp. A-GB1]|uniref:ArsR/SmtB family transcription factor n=1 Tax=Natronococcus sp. A-GB1 TaxID=3037648 RepID=UPI002420269D|nr:helix-turn-helix domain-containing protein [Natronococcus sp. A-GB1]MDG5761492.1 helix-turn-helix domain-containing protein [Natronococcus sp. A-GB1]
MARLFPFRSEPESEEGQPRIVDLEGEDADAVFGALSSTTARRIYAQVDDEPSTPSDIAEAIDSSIQNVRYHLENLEEAGLVTVVDTWYSSRGNEMSVYAATDGPLIVTSDESKASQLRAALSRFVGGLTALAGASLLVQYSVTRWFGAAAGTAPGADDGDTADTAGDEVTTEDTETEDEDVGIAGEDADEPDQADDPGTRDPNGDGAEGGDAILGGGETAEAVFATVPPGLLFFLGGLAVLLAVTCYWYWSRPAY